MFTNVAKLTKLALADKPKILREYLQTQHVKTTNKYLIKLSFVYIHWNITSNSSYIDCRKLMRLISVWINKYLISISRGLRLVLSGVELLAGFSWIRFLSCRWKALMPTILPSPPGRRKIWISIRMCLRSMSLSIMKKWRRSQISSSSPLLQPSTTGSSSTSKIYSRTNWMLPIWYSIAKIKAVRK